MTTPLVQAISSVTNDIFKGNSRIVVASATSPPAVPTKIEDIIGTDSSNSSTYLKLATGWRDIGRTSEDGATITNSFDRTDGIATDQDDSPIGGGDPTNYATTVQFTLLEFNEANLRLALGLPASTAIAAATGNVAQKVQGLNGITSLTQQQIAVLQQHPVSKVLQLWYYRIATIESIGDLQLNKNPNGVQVTLTLRPDLSITDGTKYGKRFVTDAAI